MSSPIAFIIGSGAHLGQAIALKFKNEGYRVAIGSRNPNKAEAEKDGYLPITINVSKDETIEAGFDTIRETYGASPNVVVFNPSNHVAFPVKGEALSLDIPSVQNSTDLGVGIFAAAKQSLSGFRDLVKSGNTQPKAFILTGNALPWISVTQPPWDGYTLLGLEKRIAAFFVETFAAAHEKESFKFRFGDQNDVNGNPAGAKFSGEAHAAAYWNIVQGKESGGWYHRFGPDGVELKLPLKPRY